MEVLTASVHAWPFLYYTYHIGVNFMWLNFYSKSKKGFCEFNVHSKVFCGLYFVQSTLEQKEQKETSQNYLLYGIL